MSPKVVHVVHDAERKVMETISLQRVRNYYYLKKRKLERALAPKLRQLKSTLDALERDGDWLLAVTSGLRGADELLTRKQKDSFRFPNSLILFEAWMDAGMGALFPRVAFNFDFPGIRKGEVRRHAFWFVFATSRGFGFPITFPPSFFQYELPGGCLTRALNYPFDWFNAVNRWNNKFIAYLDRKFNVGRHHPGEFESVIVSKYENGAGRSGYYGIDTVLHGFREKDPVFLGEASSLFDLLEEVTFTYSLGDHAVRVLRGNVEPSRPVRLVSHQELRRDYDVDLEKYLRHVIHLDSVIRKRMEEETARKREKRGALPLPQRVKVWLRPKVKRIKPKHLAAGYLEEDARLQFLYDLRTELWNSPLFAHAIAGEFEGGVGQKKDSILLVKAYEFEETWGIKYDAIVRDLKKIRDEMARIYFYFKARHLEWAQRALLEVSGRISREKPHPKQVLAAVDELVPVFTVYELLQRPLSDSAYPEMMPPRKKFWSFVARFLNYRFNPFGVPMITLHNKLAFRRWAWLIRERGMNFREFFQFVSKLPIWTHVDFKTPRIQDR
ncbi:MAG: hypothetical protein Kow0069_00820 [Promethearchaeota archaeon]